jgi:hypothetical protein
MEDSERSTMSAAAMLFEPQFVKSLENWLDKAPVELQRQAQDVIFMLTDLTAKTRLDHTRIESSVRNDPRTTVLAGLIVPRRQRLFYAWMAFTVSY